ncbi:SDR family oxidoreductase [Corynebacterium glutamicum]|uniref:SDR family oxidoreductase n=1 Tax=Corynebacterium glutamicum TaxID=1718 RepID=UPI001B8C9C4F|nr:SDR family oxidoreductase [Corynebacterium glutamicum]
MSETVLVIGATGSIGRHVVSEALNQGYRVKAFVRSKSRARVLPAEAEIIIGDLLDPASIEKAVTGVQGIVFTHGTTIRESDVRDIDYTGVANTLKAVKGKDVKLVLMTAVGTTRPGVAYAEWKRHGEQLVRASGHDYTIVRPGWFDYNNDDERQIVMLQGDTNQSGGPADGVIARDQIARVLVSSLNDAKARNKTFELSATHAVAQESLTATFATLQTDNSGEIEGILDTNIVPVESSATLFQADLASISS